MKSGEDFSRLEKKFKHLQSRHAGRNLNDFAGPVQRLRDMIPDTRGESLRNLGNQHDPSLILRDEDPIQWSRHLSEAAHVLPMFNKELSKAIAFDDAYGTVYTVL